MKTTLKAAATTLALAFAITTLAACAPTATTPTTPAKSKPAASAPAATPSAKPMSEFDKQVAAQTAPRNYTMPDGSVVSVDPTKPLPEPVKAAVAAELAPHVTNASSHTPDEVFGALNAQAAATGRGVVAVASSFASGRTQWYAVASGQIQGLFPSKSTKAEAVAEATAWAKERGFDVIVYG
jgi:hypothetical protein